MFGLTRTSPAPDPSPTAVVDRVADARKRLADAAARIPAARDERATVDREIAEALGVQMATGQPQDIPGLRARRDALGNEIEELEATVATIRAGMAAAEREEKKANVALLHTDMTKVRAALIPQLRRSIDVLEELAAVYAEVHALASEEWSLWLKAMRLSEELALPTPPHSNVPTRLSPAQGIAGRDIFGAPFAALLSTDSVAPELFRDAVDRFAVVIADAEKANRAG